MIIKISKMLIMMYSRQALLKTQVLMHMNNHINSNLLLLSLRRARTLPLKLILNPSQWDQEIFRLSVLPSSQTKGLASSDL